MKIKSFIQIIVFPIILFAVVVISILTQSLFSDIAPTSLPVAANVSPIPPSDNGGIKIYTPTPLKLTPPSTNSPTNVSINTDTPTLTSSATPTPTNTPSPPPSDTPSLAPTNTPTPALTPTATLPPSETPTANAIPSSTATSTPPPPTLQPQRKANLVYVQSNFQSHYIGIIGFDGSSIKEELHRHAAAPAWAPDGSKIAFFGEQGISQLGGIYSIGNGIWLVDNQGGNPKQLITVDHVKNVTWSSDGTKLAFETEVPNVVAPEVRIIDAVGGRESSRFAGEEPAWSSDNQWLAIRTCRPACGLWQVSSDGNNATQLTFHGSDSFPSWSPNGNYLAFTSQRDGNWEIYRLRLSDGQLENLTRRPATDTTPVFGPNSQEIYIRTDDQGGSNFWRITAISINGSDQGERLVREGVGPSDDWGLARPAVR